MLGFRSAAYCNERDVHAHPEHHLHCPGVALLQVEQIRGRLLLFLLLALFFYIALLFNPGLVWGPGHVCHGQLQGFGEDEGADARSRVQARAHHMLVEPMVEEASQDGREGHHRQDDEGLPKIPVLDWRFFTRAHVFDDVL
jgi:hypothetical protein